MTNPNNEKVFTKLTTTSRGFKQMTWDEIANSIREDHGTYEFSIDLLRSGNLSKKERAEIKQKDLPVFFTATFKDGAETATEATSFSKGYMCFDLDFYEPELVSHLRESLMANKTLRKIVFMVFKSPSGGLKFLIKTDLVTDNAGLFSMAYQRVADLLSIKIIEGLPSGTGINDDNFTVCDMQCKNINRPCYFSVDPDLYYNPDCSTLRISAKMHQLYNEMIEKEQEFQREMARVAKELNATEDHEGRMRYREAAIKNIMASMYEGKRHNKYWYLAKVILETGGTEHDVYCAFHDCQMIGQWTENMSPQAKARDCYKHFLAKGLPQKAFYKEQHEVGLKARLRQIKRDRGIIN